MGQWMTWDVWTPAICSSVRAEDMTVAPPGSGHSTSPSTCSSRGSQVTVAHRASVTIISVVAGKVRLMAPTLRCSSPVVRYR